MRTTDSDDARLSDVRLAMQLARLRAALQPSDGSHRPPPAAATELLALDTQPGGFVAVRIRHTALASPEGRGADWRLTVLTLTGLDADGMRFVPVMPGVERDLLALLGCGAKRAGRGAADEYSWTHAVIRDECGVVRPRFWPGGAAPAR